MEFKKFENTYFLSLNKGDEIVSSVLAFCKNQGIFAGQISGIGAVNKAVLGLFKTDTKKYLKREIAMDMEIASLTGNVSCMDDESYVHIHAVLSDAGLRTYGGHLNEAYVSAACEIIINQALVKLVRKPIQEIGLNILCLEE